VIESESGSFSNNVSWINKIVQDRVVNRRQSSASWSLLSLEVVISGWFGQDFSLGNNNNVFSAELLFQFSDQTRLDLVEVRKKLVWNKNDDCSSCTFSERDFFGGRDVKVSEVGAKIRRAIFNISQRCCNGLLCR